MPKKKVKTQQLTEQTKMFDMMSKNLLKLMNFLCFSKEEAVSEV